MTSAMLPPAPGGGPIEESAAEHQVLEARTGGGFWGD
ncbi:MAG: ABC transporter permease, partial [Microbacterium sp.]